MKILFVQPPFHRAKGMFWGGFPSGIGYLAGVMKKEGYTCKIYNAELRQPTDPLPIIKKNMDRYRNYHRYLDSLKNPNHFVWKEFLKVLNEFSPSIIGITFTSPAIDSALQIARIAKTKSSNVQVVMGGPHASCQPKEVISHSEVDYVIIGEGEGPFLELVRYIAGKRKDRSKILSLCYKNGDQIHISKLAPRILDIDSLPCPDKDCNIAAPPIGISRNSVIAARGCPFRCTFCSSRNVWGKRVTVRSAESVFEELIMLKERYGINNFCIYDDTFTFNHARVKSFCNLVKDKGVPFPWDCNTRVDRVNEEMVRLLTECGCEMVSVGIESADEAILEKMNKKYKLADVLNAVELFHKYKLKFGAYFIAGHPDETLDSMEKSYQMMKAIRADYLYFTVLTPYPKTQLMNELVMRNIIEEKPDWKLFSTDSPYGLLSQKIDKDIFWKHFEKMSEFVDKTNLYSLKTRLNKFKMNLSKAIKQPDKITHKIKAIIKRKFATYAN